MEKPENSAENGEEALPAPDGPKRYKVGVGEQFPFAASIRWVPPYGAAPGVAVVWIALFLFLLALAVLTIENAKIAALILAPFLLFALLGGRHGRRGRCRHHHHRRRHRHHRRQRGGQESEAAA